MTPAQAAELLKGVISSRQQGMTWRMLAAVHGYESPQAMKKAARQAAKVSQSFLLSQVANGQR